MQECENKIKYSVNLFTEHVFQKHAFYFDRKECEYRF